MTIPYLRLYLSTFLMMSLFLLSCSEDDETNDDQTPITEASSEITDTNGNTYKVGFDQVSSNNQNSWVEKYDNSNQLIWRKVHSSTGVDERAVFVTLAPDGSPWVVFTVDGGSNSSDYITKKEVVNGAFDNVFLNGYGRASGAAKVAIVARLNPESGNIEKGTFLMSRTNEGNFNATDKTNTFVVDNIAVTENRVRIEGRSWFKPPSAEATASNFVHHPDATDENKSGSSWKMYLELPINLNQLLVSEVVK